MRRQLTWFLMLTMQTFVVDAADFGAAKWLWPQELGSVTNTTIEFRQCFFSGNEVPLKLVLAADSVYAVELNGFGVHSGRLPDVPPRRYYDVLRVGKARRGENELRIKLYVQGIDSFQTLSGDPGLMFVLSGKGVYEESGNGTEWRISMRDRRDGVPLVTSQLGFSFEYDAARPEAEWRAIIAKDAVRNSNSFVLEERPVPKVEILPELPTVVISQGGLDGSSVPNAVAVGMDETDMIPARADDFFAGDSKNVREKFFKDGFYVLTDLGREEAGLFAMEVDTDEGVVIDIGYAEHMENGRIRTSIGGRNFAGRYRTRDGRQSFCRWARRMAGRYLQLHVRGVRTHFTLQSVTLRPVELPLVELPVPETLTGLQKEIWKTSVRTLRLCMHEHYEDCPWREQALYGNDARNQMLCGYYAFGKENRMPEFALRLLERGLGDDGWMELCMPARIPITIPSFTFCWVLALNDNLHYRCDPAFVYTMLPTVKKVLDTHLAEMRDGLLPCPEGKRYWHFYEWTPGLDGDFWNGMKGADPNKLRVDAPLNLFFILALEAGANCAEVVGDVSAAKRWKTGADEIRKAVGARFWNPDKVQMETAINTRCASELVQSLALLAKAAPSEARSEVARKLSMPSDWTEITLSQTLYKYEALIATGVPIKSVIRTMDEEWSKMLDRGATSFWEMREGWPAFGGAGSLCHGWSAIPIYLYGKYLGRQSAASKGKR